MEHKKERKLVDISLIDPHPFNFFTSTPEDEESMFESINNVGLQTCPIITPDKSKLGRYKTGSGHLRIATLRKSGVTKVLCDVVIYENEEDEIDALIACNLHRGLKHIEIGWSIDWKNKHTMKKKGFRSDLKGIPQNERITNAEQLGKIYKISSTKVKWYILIMKFQPELLKLVDQKVISLQKVKELVQFLVAAKVPSQNYQDLKLKIIELCDPKLFDVVKKELISLDIAVSSTLSHISFKHKLKELKKVEIGNLIPSVDSGSKTDTGNVVVAEISTADNANKIMAKHQNLDSTKNLLPTLVSTPTIILEPESLDDIVTDAPASEIETVIEQISIDVQNNVAEIQTKFDAYLATLSDEQICDLILHHLSGKPIIREFLNSNLTIDQKNEALQSVETLHV